MLRSLQIQEIKSFADWDRHRQEVLVLMCSGVQEFELYRNWSSHQLCEFCCASTLPEEGSGGGTLNEQRSRGDRKVRIEKKKQEASQFVRKHFSGARAVFFALPKWLHGIRQW